MQWLLDKRNTYRLANELGIPTPRTWYVQDAGVSSRFRTTSFALSRP